MIRPIFSGMAIQVDNEEKEKSIKSKLVLAPIVEITTMHNRTVDVHKLSLQSLYQYVSQVAMQKVMIREMEISEITRIIAPEVISAVTYVISDMLTTGSYAGEFMWISLDDPLETDKYLQAFYNVCKKEFPELVILHKVEKRDNNRDLFLRIDITPNQGIKNPNHNYLDVSAFNH